MAQASSAQREPSMEEILASIRRIIEDNETGRQEERGQAASDAPASTAADVDSFHAELRVAAANAQPRPAGTAVSEDFEEATEEPDSSWREDATAEAAASSAQPYPLVDQEADAGSSAEEDAPSADHSAFPMRSSEAPEAPYSGGAFHRDIPSRQGLFEHAQHAVERAARTEEEADARPSMLSEDTGRKVAAAFGELSEAFEATRRKNLTEAAEEMLRPMLQEWLDNNLPQIVEKLVREEIERIARG
ncbi:DUF2497 domain-containing protein [Chelativorans sp. M5D2P16]|nr:DUF2497 domain-containing protein [Chelativorans sp. M5D2P16]MDZ5696999.1 DUF2497 domain-containing protein [Chelativorans sp. M5D2P16]